MAWQVNVVAGTLLVAAGITMLIIASLLKRGTIKPSRIWGQSASAAFWMGIGILAWGLAKLAPLVVAKDIASYLDIIGAIVFIVAMLVARAKAKKGSAQ